MFISRKTIISQLQIKENKEQSFLVCLSTWIPFLPVLISDQMGKNNYLNFCALLQYVLVTVLISMTKIYDVTYERKDLFCFSFQGYSPLWQRRHGGRSVGSHYVCSQEAEIHKYWHLAHFLHLIPSWTLTHGVMLLTFRVDHPTSIHSHWYKTCLLYDSRSCWVDSINPHRA